MSSDNVLKSVEHYKRSIEKNPADEARLLHCVAKLYKIPITVEHLQQTGIGRIVNALRKYEGELSYAAEAVVNKWKLLVATESDMRAGNQSPEQEDDDMDDDDDGDDNNSEKDETKKNENGSAVEHTQQTKQDSPDSSSSMKKSRDEKTIKEDAQDRKKDPTLKSSSSQHRSTSSSERNQKPQPHPSNHHHHKSEHRDKSNKGHHSSSKDEVGNDKKHKTHSKSDAQEVKERSRNEEHKSRSSKKHIDSKDKDDRHRSNEKSKHNEKHHDSQRGGKDIKSKSKSHSESKSRSDSTTANKTTTNCSSSVSEKCVDALPSTSTATEISSSSSSGKKRRHHESDGEKGGDKEIQTMKKPKPSSSSRNNDNMTTSKKVDKKNNERDVDDDGIDSSMGANFEDVLGMLNMPQKKAKKSLSALKTTSPKKNTVESESGSSSKVNGISKSEERPSTSKSTTTTNASHSKLEKKPELLKSAAKLPPLDPSIALELPMISNNYKPLPLNPTVMDCVFNSSTSSSSRAPPRMFSDAEAISHGISSKTMRTKVYSGVKTGQLHQVPSLFDLCIRILQKNIDALEYTGGVPFDVLRPVLERATPQQLFIFEEYNPYLMEDSDVLWQLHVQRNYRAHKREEMESWREMFMRCQEDQERRLSMLAENIKQSQKAIALPVRKTQLAFVDSMVKPPRNVLKKQEQYGTKSKMVATPAARVASLSSVTPNAAKQGDARLRVAAACSQEPVKLSNNSMRPKKAPLMAKTLQFMRGRLKR